MKEKNLVLSYKYVVTVCTSSNFIRRRPCGAAINTLVDLNKFKLAVVTPSLNPVQSSYSDVVKFWSA